MEKIKNPAANNPAKCGWRVAEFAAAVGLCRASVYNLMSDGKLASVKSGSARIITTAPADYLLSLAGAVELAHAGARGAAQIWAV